VVVIGIEDQWTKQVVDGIAATGKPVAGFGIELHGDHDTIMRASKAAREFVQWASEKQREDCALAELWVSTKCGESDTTPVAARIPPSATRSTSSTGRGARWCSARPPRSPAREAAAGALPHAEVWNRFMFMFDRYQDMINRHKTSDLSDSQPTKGNIAAD